jgi:signal peptidase I
MLAMGGFVRFVVFLLLLFGAIAAGLRATCMAFWTVPSDDPLFAASIMPTLEAGDLVVLWRLGQPGYAELVRCESPEVPGRYAVGRILGEQGDQLNGTAHSISVNRRVISAAHACPNGPYVVAHPVSGDPVELVCEAEEAGGNDYTRLRYEVMPQNPETFSHTVANGNVYLISDDRPFHNDSRDFGPLARTSCKERIFFRLWSVRGWSDVARRMSIIH